MATDKQKSAMEVQEQKSALLSNAQAVGAVAGAVEGTLGPKGLNCMLVGRFGDVVISNDGRAILEQMEVSHPAAQLLVQSAQAQDREAGDGTTTACILASALVAEGAGRVLDGVPAVKVVEGIRAGVARAVAAIREQSRAIAGMEDPLLLAVARIAARGRAEVASLVLEGARVAGAEKLAQRGFRLAHWVMAKGEAQSEVFCGLVLEKGPVNRQMPRDLGPVKLLLVDDALECEEVASEALATEAGYRRCRELQEAHRAGLSRIVEAGVNLVLCARGLSEEAEQLLGEAGVMAVRRVAPAELAKVAQHTGARPVKRGWLAAAGGDFAKITGAAARAYYDDKLEQLRIEGGAGERAATILVGASTGQMKEELRRIAEDAACAAQQALLGGVVAGGGSAEMAAAGCVEAARAEISGMAAYGADCVAAALRRPFSQIVTNAGFNPLEKVEELKKAMASGEKSAGLDADSGEIRELFALGVVDATNIKIQALNTAAEVAEAILLINTIIRRRDGGAAA